MRKVLYVDDSPEDLEAARRCFKEGGIDIRLVDNAMSAMAALKEQSYDLIISDILMPGRDGIAFAKEISESEIATPIIFASSVLALARFRKYQGLKNYKGFILKPITPEKIIDFMGNE